MILLDWLTEMISTVQEIAGLLLMSLSPRG